MFRRINLLFVMINAYRTQNGLAVKTNVLHQATSAHFLIDLFQPTSDEVEQVENYAKLQLPCAQINCSNIANRFFVASDAYFMTLLTHEDTNILLVLKENALITLRDSTPFPFRIFSNSAVTAKESLLFFIDMFIQEIYELLEAHEKTTLDLSKTINNYAKNEAASRVQQSTSQKMTIVTLNKEHTSIMRIRRSLFNLRLLIDFTNKQGLSILGPAAQQVDLLIEHTDFLNDQLAFLQGTVFDYIGIAQYNVQYIFNIISATLLIPMLITGFFGMNFPDVPFLGVKNSVFFFILIGSIGAYFIYHSLQDLQFA